MPSLPPTAQPARRVFDPWNSSSTGHQYAENRLSGSTSWRESRTAKLASQFGDQSRGGGERIYDTVGAGALGFGKDGRKENGGWDESVRGARGKAGMKTGDVGKTGDIGAWLRGEKQGLRGGIVENLKRERLEEEAVIREREGKRRKTKAIESDNSLEAAEAEWRRKEDEARAQRHWTEETMSLDELPAELRRPTTAKSVEFAREDYERATSQRPPEAEGVGPPNLADRDPLLDNTETTILQNCVFYINGSTMPLISDHRLKYLISQHGGLTNIALGRKTVTHVIVGTPNGKGGFGGGLSGRKIQQEVDKIRGKSVKYIGVEWLLESIKAGKRLPEARFASSGVSTSGPGVKSVYGMFKQTKPGAQKNQPGK